MAFPHSVPHPTLTKLNVRLAPILDVPSLEGDARKRSFVWQGDERPLSTQCGRSRLRDNADRP